jgi:hypothetical protein
VNGRLVFVFLILLGFTLIFFLANPTHQGGPRDQKPLAEVPEVPIKPEKPVSISIGPGSMEREADSNLAGELRAQATTSGMEGRVVTANGGVVEGASVRWISLNSMDLEWEPAWQVDDWGALKRPTLTTVSDALGRFRFEDRLDDSVASVVWAAHEGHVANGVVRRGGGTERVDAPLSIELEPHAPLRVLVVDGEGREVMGATVEHFGLTPADSPRGSGGLTIERARRFFVERATTDVDGIAVLGSFPGEQVLVATKGESSSLPWRGGAEAEVKLVVNPTFTVGGTVALPDWGFLNYEGERRITIEHTLGMRSVSLASLRDVKAGPWGPVRVPWFPKGSYRIRLEGSPIIPVDESIVAASPGMHYAIDLIANLGHSLYFVAETERREVIPDAEVAAYFEVDGMQHVVRRRAGEDGYMIPWSFPDGVVVRAFISAAGYTGSWAEEIPMPETKRALYPVVLHPAAAIRGRVTYGGKPVRDFRILAWLPRLYSYTHVTRTFLDREDGTFDFEGVPAGMISVAAITDAHPRTRPILWQAPSTQVLALEILDGVPGEDVTGIAADEEESVPARSEAGLGNDRFHSRPRRRRGQDDSPSGSAPSGSGLSKS